MGRGDRSSKAGQAKDLLYGPRPQGPGPSIIEEEEVTEKVEEELPPVPESVIDTRDRIPLDDMRSRGIEEVIVHYSGYGDSGDIEHVEVKPSGKELQDDEEDILSDLTFELLGARHGGWEINEGSNGTVSLDLKKGSIEHDHYTNYVSQHHDNDEMAL